MGTVFLWLNPMQFPARLIQFRKAQNFTQQELADTAQVHVNQIKRYEAGSAQPTLEALVRLAKALHISLDTLVFSDDERKPADDLSLHFEAISQFEADEKEVAKAVLEGLILKHQAGRFRR
ncbi:helix-turn-helix transcriptional regulator [Erwinia pyrifoliae]|uniref:Helix-turn-helix transcriptional regulator n=2 Tax=Erwinia pyrifoliae TaxID=79967 RepID=A0ABY5X773_ERWPY|nr:helix-turn-helix transcriptional regulator [Erwinia pyrifoliae]UWS29791.1 helix-turn-helix transcriptional regulator [Erwinia pyrifoliae]UWS29798.1 helix-turn-helix transcriptional regulator [Erwinia pyrifoliae]UWS33209.1 helix-turn-helix transcriptional regulator [Erwinia pyrifoliae]UWS33217.1 helix-turn-helix transcriptional regulator [Erwinia pyrifoliae]UXK11297.1 helix-turn-helix transcriptional regulator [Erwinia pyrifoliae]